MVAVVTGWSIDDRAGARAFLQRCEVRLSPLHRVATALLSGAALMVLLPAIAKDQIETVLRTLLTAETNVPHVQLPVIALVVLAMPLTVLFLLLGDLTRFYFHARNDPGEGAAAFAPRFTLTGLRLPAGDLSPAGEADLAAVRIDPATIELLVPPNPAARASIHRKLAADLTATTTPATRAASTDYLSSSPPARKLPLRRSPKSNSAWPAICYGSKSSCCATSKRSSRFSPPHSRCSPRQVSAKAAQRSE